MDHSLQTRLIVPTTTLIFSELEWLIQNLRRASDGVLAACDTRSVQNLMAWRRLAFRLFPAQLEAFANTYRTLCNLRRLMGSLRFEPPADLIHDRRWRRQSSSRRYTLALDAILQAVGAERTEDERVRLSDLLGKLRVTRRRLAHPKLPTELMPEAQESETLRRTMLSVVTEQSHVLQAVIPAGERRWADLRLDRSGTQAARLPSRQILADDWDDDFYRKVADCRGKTEHLVHVMLQELLGPDSIWAMQQAAADARKHEWPGGVRHRHGVLARILGATFFGEIEGTCAVLSRAVLYALHRGETEVDGEDVEWLECVSGLRPMGKARQSVKERLDLASQVKDSLTHYARAYGGRCKQELSGEDWSAFLKAIELRDRMYHPTGITDLVPSADDYEGLLKAMSWFRRVRDEIAPGTG